MQMRDWRTRIDLEFRKILGNRLSRLAFIEENIAEIVVHHGLSWIQGFSFLQQPSCVFETPLPEPHDGEIQVDIRKVSLRGDGAIEYCFSPVDLVQSQIHRAEIRQRRIVLWIALQPPAIARCSTLASPRVAS